MDTTPDYTDDPKERAERIARHAKWMAEDHEGMLLKARKQLVAKYRANPSQFPSGPDGRAWGGDAWYNPEEWTDAGNYIGPVTKVDVTKVAKENVTKVAAELVNTQMGRPAIGDRPMTDAERKSRQRERLKAAREALEIAEKATEKS